MEKKKIILFNQGGAGDGLSHTPMIRSFRNQYPDDEIIVLSTYSQLLENNPNIDVLISLKDPKPRDFFDQYINNKDVRFIRKRFVYDYFYEIEGTFALNAKTLPEFICTCYGADYDGKPLDYFITEEEHRAAQTFMQQTKKKKVLIQVKGAVPSDGGYGIFPCPNCAGQGVNQEGVCKNCGGKGKIVSAQQTNYHKDIDPKMLEPIVDKYRDQIDFLQIGLEGEPLVTGAIDCLGMGMRETIALIAYCDSFLFIESLFAHCSNALGKSGVVFCNNTDPKFFGYSNNINLSNSGGCKIHPCNCCIGPIPRYFAGFENPKTRQVVSWRCKEQTCNVFKTKDIEDALLKTLDANAKKRPMGDGGFNTLTEARNSGIKNKSKYKLKNNDEKLELKTKKRRKEER